MKVIRMTAPRFCSVLLVILIAPACGDSQDTGNEFASSSAIIYGVVQRPSADPVVGAQVLVGVYREACGVGESEVPSDVLITGPDGSYRTHLVAITEGFSACVRVTAREPGSANEVPGVTVDGAVDFRLEPVDSVRVDVELPV
jgi:hypothetical protein